MSDYHPVNYTPGASASGINGGKLAEYMTTHFATARLDDQIERSTEPALQSHAGTMMV